MGDSGLFLRYDAAKVSIDKATTTKHKRRVRGRAGSIINALPLREINCWTSLQTTPRSDVPYALVNIKISK